MEVHRHGTVLACIGLYMLACVAVGVWSLRRTTSVGEFFVAGRRLGVLVTSMAIFSSIISGFTFVGGPGLVYRAGMSSMWMAVGMTIGTVLAVVLVSKRLRLLAELRDALSLPDAVAARYGSEAARLLAAVAILLGVLAYLATQLVAMATVLRSLLVEAGLVESIPLGWCVAVSCAVLVFYCVTGGIVAGVYTDLFQGLIMLAAAVLVFLAARSALDGGLPAAGAAMHADDPESIGPWGTMGMLTGLSWLFLFAVGACGQPHVITKHMMFRSIRDVKGILVVTSLAGLFTVPLVLGVGMVMRAAVLTGQRPPLDAADAAAPAFLLAYAHPLLAGVVFAALFAAIMSTADSFLNIGTAAIARDIPKALRGRTPARELLWARAATVILALAAALFGLYAGDLVALLGAFGWGTFAAALVPVVAIGFNWKRATALAANVTIVFSLASNFTLKLLDVTLPYGIDGGAATLLVALLLFLGVSLASPPPKLDRDVAAVMGM